ncbi:MAG: DUF2752 domain-containing protein [Lutimonas sp.]
MGVECMGCGLQRSVVLILKGEFTEAFYMYPAIYSLLFMFGFLLLHLKFQFAKGHKVLLWLFIFNLLIIITNYILKII